MLTSTEHKYILLLNVKMSKIVVLLIFIIRINPPSKCIKVGNSSITSILIEILYSAQLSMMLTLGPVTFSNVYFELIIRHSVGLNHSTAWCISVIHFFQNELRNGLDFY